MRLLKADINTISIVSLKISPKYSLRNALGWKTEKPLLSNSTQGTRDFQLKSLCLLLSVPLSTSSLAAEKHPILIFKYNYTCVQLKPQPRMSRSHTLLIIYFPFPK